MLDFLLDILLQVVVYVLVVAFFFGTAALLGWLVGGGGVRHNATTGVTILRYGKVHRGLGVVCVLFFASLGMASVFADPALARFYALFWGCWFLLGAWWMVEASRKEVRLDRFGITARSWSGRRTTIGWQEIERISHRGWPLGWFVVCGAGMRIRLSHYLEGLDHFKNECRGRLTAEVYGTELDKPLSRDYF